MTWNKWILGIAAVLLVSGITTGVKVVWALNGDVIRIEQKQEFTDQSIKDIKKTLDKIDRKLDRALLR